MKSCNGGVKPIKISKISSDLKINAKNTNRLRLRSSLHLRFFGDGSINVHTSTSSRLTINLSENM
jgi:hypothetical protein